MRTIFSDPTLQSELKEKGYTKVPLLSEAEVNYILDALQSLRPNDNFAPDGKGTTRSTYHCSFLDTNVDYKRKANNLIRQVFSSHIRQLLVGYEILNCNFYVKPSGTGVFQIHQNWPFMDLNDTSITVWCPLVDADERNGSLHVVEGSHKIVPEVSGPWGNPFFRNFEKELLEKYLKPISCRAGEAVAFDDSLIHWSSRNNSASPRVAIQVLCVPTDTTPVFFYLDKNAPEKGFEMFEIDSDYFIERTITDLLKRPSDLKSLGFVENRNVALTIEEFAEKLKHGDEIRQKIYSSWGVNQQ
jgi:Phytanoyl-CoA dioxygenase (PhyH)